MMPQPYEYFPKAQNHLAPTIGMAGLLGAALLFLAARMMSAYAVFPQLAGVVLLTLGALMVARCCVRFRYRIEEDPEVPGAFDLTVALLRGKKIRTVCRLSLSDLHRVEVVTPACRRQVMKKYHNDLIHSYCPGLLPARSLILRFDESDSAVVVRLCPDDTLERMLLDAQSRNTASDSPEKP